MNWSIVCIDDLGRACQRVVQEALDRLGERAEDVSWGFTVANGATIAIKADTGSETVLVATSEMSSTAEAINLVFDRGLAAIARLERDA